MVTNSFPKEEPLASKLIWKHQIEYIINPRLEGLHLWLFAATKQMLRAEDKRAELSALSGMYQVYPLLQRLGDHCWRGGEKSVCSRSSGHSRGAAVWSLRGCDGTPDLSKLEPDQIPTWEKRWAQNSTPEELLELLAIVSSSQHP